MRLPLLTLPLPLNICPLLLLLLTPPEEEPSRYPSRLRTRPGHLQDFEVNNVTVIEALKESPDLVAEAILLEMKQMIDKKVFHPVKHAP
jgi:hypothetical protein